MTVNWDAYAASACSAIKSGLGDGSTLTVIANAIASSLQMGGKVLFFGNGGSAAEAQHLAAEFVGRFRKERRALAAVALTSDSAVVSAIGNDYGFENVFARQVAALARPEDVVVGLTTSGQSANVIRGLEQAREVGATTICLVGSPNNSLVHTCDHLLFVDSTVTAHVQEAHLAMGQALCWAVESIMFGEG